ncbi:MAG TPA: DUF2652 domain-containing protein [Myxococcales bacterium]|nr:DUF2652 domain-containing protein [Myxococcales bacterium]
MGIERALMLIADIGGYTRFMKVHRINLAHAQTVVTELMEAVIDGAPSPLKLSKLEGDAAFFYAPLSRKETDLTRFAQLVTSIRLSFLRRQREMTIDQVCTCDGCTQVGQLKLKFVAHDGEVAVHRVKRMQELAGVDVIAVHRMLKNSVPLSEYVLMTDRVAGALAAPLQPFLNRGEEDLEGLGKVVTYYVDLNEIARAPPPEVLPSPTRRWMSYFRLTARALPYMLGLKKSCEGFHNMDPVLGGQRALPGGAPTGTPS